MISIGYKFLVRLLLAGSVAGLTAAAAGAQQASDRPAITGIAFARMYSADPAASDRFYTMLGLAKEKRAGQPIARYDVNRTQWVETEALPQPAPAARLAAVGYTTTDAARLERYLRSHGVQIQHPLAGGMFTVLDPEGNAVAFVQQGSHAAEMAGAVRTGMPTSRRIIHVGYVVHHQDAEDRFYRDLLGFRPYWHGGMTDDKTEFISLQVPDGTDWMEYMLNARLPEDAVGRLRQYGVMDHFSLGVTKMAPVVAALQQNGCGTTGQAANCGKMQAGRDGKVQLNVFDPDGTRVEFMEFAPSGTICCSAFTGKHPAETDQENR